MMSSHFRLSLGVALTCLSACAGTPQLTANASSSPRPVELFEQWLVGEFNNNEQVWQHKLDEASLLPPHRHQLVVPIPNAANNGDQASLFFVQQYSVDEERTAKRLIGEPFLLRISSETDAEIRTEQLRLSRPTSLVDAHLDPARLRALRTHPIATDQHCTIAWRFLGDEFKGSGQCRVSEAAEVAAVQASLSEQIWSEQWGTEPPVSYRKTSYYNGWAAVKRAGINAGADDNEWVLMRPIVLHNEGQIVRIVDDQGNPSGYSIELARLTYQGSNRQAILKLGVIDDATGKTLRYSWANPQAKQLGINLRWFTAGVTIKSEHPNLGFSPSH